MNRAGRVALRHIQLHEMRQRGFVDFASASAVPQSAVHSMRQLARWFAVLMLCALVVGCSEELDWRELHSQAGGFALMLPSKPASIDHAAQIGQASVQLHMLSSELDGMAFGAAYAERPANIPAERLLSDSRDALLRNINGRVETEQRIEVGQARGIEFHAVGQAGAEPMRLAARLLVDHDRLYQVVFIGRTARAADVDLRFYLDSFRLLR